MFSNRLRIVDEVPAFDAVRRAVQIKPNERLAVLVPTEVERKLESAQLHAASKRGLSMKRVRYFAGRFRLRNGDLGFEITGVQRRSPTQ